jgi:hypothetical protein
MDVTPMPTPRGSRAICLDFNGPEHYDACIRDNALYRRYLEEQYREHPELFPPEMEGGFTFHDRRVSEKLQDGDTPDSLEDLELHPPNPSRVHYALHGCHGR